eukprot:scaffold7673_cov258-Pinguiococcus_pyrenoidosus.AAC.14
MSVDPGTFDVYVAKQDFKFHCAHFVTFSGFRERMHGHNYNVGVALKGSHLGPDGYVVDFGDIKKVTRRLCKELNERFICPMYSDVMEVELGEDQVVLRCEDGAYFSLPRGDCAVLPLVHSTAEEISRFFWCNLVQEFTIEWLKARGVTAVEITVSEAASQQAVYRRAVPEDDEELDALRRQLYEQPLPPMPCAACREDED